jgi:hypothetical protein
VLGIPFCGLVPHPTQAGPFKLWVRSKEKSKKKQAALTVNYEDISLTPRDARINLTLSVDTQPNTGHDEALCCLLPVPPATRNWLLIKSVIS